MKLKKILSFSALIMALFSQVSLADEYVVAVRAKGGVEQAIQQWQPTIDYLSRKFDDHTFRLKPVVSLEEISQLAGKGEFDFLMTNPASYVELKHLNGAIALATLNNKRANTAQSRFGSVIFTHAKNDDIITLADLKGKRVMAVSEPAFGGWRVAMLEMLSNDLNPQRDFSELLFAGGLQREVVYAVRDGVADVGVVRTDRLERMEAEGEIDMRYFRILNNKDISSFPFFLSTPLYPEWPFVSLNKTIPKSLLDDIQAALFELSESSAAAQAGKYVGWVTPLDYSSVEDLLKKIEVGAFGQ